jgi:hypothetical protein
MYLGNVEPWFATMWIAAILLAGPATLGLWFGGRNDGEQGRTRRRSSLLLMSAVALPVASLIAALFCFTYGRASTLSQYNDEATRPYWHLWAWLWLIFMAGIPLTSLIAIRALVLAFRPPRVRLVASSLLVIGAACVSWYAVMVSSPST